ncbi:disease resistance protein [Populus alba x Populus x berolinensis]|nr:disease resistance protein [Populus alba x Populus x berolinensis]
MKTLLIRKLLIGAGGIGSQGICAEPLIKMLRQNDPVLHRVDTSFREYVEKMNDDRLKCKFCGRLFAKGTPITRIKYHLSGRKRGGAKYCAQVPQHVRDAALEALPAIDGPPAKQRKTVAGSSNNEVTNAISASAQQQNNEMMMAHQRNDDGIPVEDMELLERGRFHERPSFNQADEHRGDPSQPTRDQLCSPSVNNDATMNVAQNVVGVRTEPVVQVLEQSNAELDNLSVDAGRKQVGVQGMELGGEEERVCSHLDMDNSMENTGEGSVQHVDRIVSPWNRRGATERLVQPGLGGSSSGVNVNHTAISTSPQEQNNEVYNLTGDGTSIQAPDMYEKSWVEIINSLMDDGIQNVIGVAQPGAGASSSGVLKYNTSETRGDPLSCAISASAQEHNNKVIHVEMAQGEPFFTGEIACDLFRGRTELVHNAPETRPLTEQASPETELPWGRNSPEELPHDAFETIPRTEHAPLLERGSSHDRQSINQVDEPRGDSSQPADLLCLGHARYDDQLCSQAVNNDAILIDVQNMDRMRKEPVEKEDMENNSGRSVQPGEGAGSSVGLKHNTSETRGAPLPIGSTKLVGRAFEENRKVIWSWLMDDEVSTIGIYGMGGAGKTTMLKHVYNELQRIAYISHYVFWVTVPRDFSIHTLLKKIAKHINLSLSNEEEELHIAAKLSLELKKRRRWILILDDLWNSFDLHKVGIPVSLKGCKLIITTRSEAICQQMNSKNNVKVNPLPDEEAWTLFMEILGHGTRLSPKVEQIAKNITRECDGLPLGIKTIAGTMKGVDDIHEWSDALEDLRQSRVPQDKVEEEVFQILRFSYTHLSDIALQQCFLYCALFPEDFEIPREKLIDYLIDEGVVKEQKSREAEINKGHTMLNRLENICLLERLHGGDSVKMHDLIRDMAIQILKENSIAIVEPGEQLEELPDAKKWTEKLTTVSLMHNQIEDICSSHSSRCPNLSTLLLCNNYGLRLIAGSFFEQMHGLKVLDLSRTFIKCLPNSVSDLVGLTSLLLKYCRRLHLVPSLKKLRALKRLDLSHSPLKKIPHGMECLSNLRYLRMNRCGEKKFPGGILPKLSRLQVLILEEHILLKRGNYRVQKYAPVTVDGKEVGCLRKLESLECHFEDHSNYVEYLKSRDETQSLSTYKIVIGQLSEYEHWELVCNGPGSKMVVLGNLNINRDGDFPVISSNDIQQLICKCIDARSLGDVSQLKYATELEFISIISCNSMESLVSSSWLCYAPLLQPSPSYNGIFSGLKRFNCCGCKGMKNLFPPVLLPSLVNLEEMIVEGCEKMEEIIDGARSDEEEDMGEESSIRNTEIKLPKLRELHLKNLPQLKSICSAKLICDSLKVIEVKNCSITEILVQSSWIRLVSLEEIIVEGCEKIEEIIGGARSDEEGDMGEESSSTELNFPQLKTLELNGLPELRSICSAKLICDSIDQIWITKCEKLKRMPIYPPLLENGEPSSPPSLRVMCIDSKEWWESIVEWEHPNAKDVLRRFVVFMNE